MYGFSGSLQGAAPGLETCEAHEGFENNHKAQHVNKTLDVETCHWASCSSGCWEEPIYKDDKSHVNWPACVSRMRLLRYAWPNRWDLPRLEPAPARSLSCFLLSAVLPPKKIHPVYAKRAQMITREVPITDNARERNIAFCTLQVCQILIRVKGQAHADVVQQVATSAGLARCLLISPPAAIQRRNPDLKSKYRTPDAYD